MNEDEFIGEHAQGDAEPAAIEQEEGPKLTATEQTAYDQGWRPEEDFEGKEGNWKTAKEYINHGEFIGQINDLKRQVNAQKTDFDERLDNTNKLNEARRKSEINDLKKAQREAVEMGDTDAYDKSQDKIDNLEKQPEAAPATPGNKHLTTWTQGLVNFIQRTTLDAISQTQTKRPHENHGKRGANYQ